MATLTLSSGPLSIRVDPSAGGRVTSLSHGGHQLLCGPETDPINWGATFWTSPQSDWGWPPIAAIDSAPYELLERSDARLSLRSARVELGERRFHVEKHFIAQAGDTIDVTYVIDNVGAKEFWTACWEISRVAAGGLTTFPSGSAELTPVPPFAELRPQRAAGFSWYEHAGFSPGENRKLHADGSAGLLAHLAGERMLVKCFNDSAAHQQAPGEGEIEIFAERGGSYVELEIQGPYVPIAAGSRHSFSLRTHVSPCTIARSDRAALAQFAMQLREQLGAPSEPST